MPVLTAYPQGVSMSRPPSNLTPPPAARRGKVDGWNSHTASRHLKWLMSVQPEALSGHDLYAFTLTTRSLPPDASDWQRLRNSWLVEVRRAVPAVLYTWVVEWQGRGAPHLHGMLAVPSGTPRETVLGLCYKTWPRVASAYGALPCGQDCRPSPGTSGWFAYMGKHSGRSASHRQRAGRPKGWTSTGRLWGHGAGWPTSSQLIDLDQQAWFAVRRLLHSWAIADARRERDPRRRADRLRYLRRRRQLPADRSRYVGLREWAPPQVVGRFLDWAAAQGYEVSRIDGATGEIIPWQPL